MIRSTVSLKCYWLFFFIVLGIHAQQQDVSHMYENISFDMPHVQEVFFNDHEVNIKDFGAIGNGLHKNTEAFQLAIEEVVAKGGGRVIVPEGIWLSGPIALKSNVNLHLNDGALLKFSKDFEDYPLIESSFEGKKALRSTSPIHAENVENIAITGNGTIDGSGGAWRPVKKGKMTSGQWDKLVASGGVLSDDEKIWFPNAGAKMGYNADVSTLSEEELKEASAFFRPVMVSLRNSKKILLDGPTFQNSPAWNIHPLMSEDIIIRNLSIRNPWYSQNGDGLDLESCKNVLVYNNTFDVGDDAICIKSGKNKDGRERGMSTKNVIIKNNIVYHGHGGFVVGSEMSGGVKNIHVSNCTFMGTDTGLRFKSTRGRGGTVENIYISDIYMTDIPVDAIRFNLFYGGKTPKIETKTDTAEDKQEAVPVTEETPSFKDIYMKNIYVDGAEQAGFFMGLPEMNLKNIQLENAILKANKGITIIDADGIQLKNVELIQQDNQALLLYNAKNTKMEGFNFNENAQGNQVRIYGPETKNIQLSKADFKNSNKQVEVENGLPKDVLSYD